MEKTRAELLALLGESLTIPAVLWVFAQTMIVRDKEHGIPGAYLAFAIVLVSMLVFFIILRKPRSVAFIAVISGILFAAGLTVHLYVYSGPIGFGYVLSSVLICASAVFATLNYCITKQTLNRHIALLDVSVMAVIWLFLNISVLNLNVYSIAAIAAVPVIDMAGAAALRMIDGGANEGAGKAFLLALVCAGGAAGIIFALSRLLSRSGNVVDAVVSAITGFFSMIWRGIAAFFTWLVSLFPAPETGEEVSLPGMETAGAFDVEIEEVYIDPAIPAVILCIIIAVITVIIIYRLRKVRLTVSLSDPSGNAVIRKKSRKKGALSRKLQAVLEALRFVGNSFIYRNTPPGVLVYLEKKAKKAKQPRLYGESMREFICRAAPGKEFEALADDLDRRYYGGKEFLLTSGECRNLRKKLHERKPDRG